MTNIIRHQFELCNSFSTLPQTDAWVARATGQKPSTQSIFSVDRFIRTMINIGLWDDWPGEFIPFGVDVPQMAFEGLKGSITNAQITGQGGVTLTPRLGVYGDGTSTFLNLGVTPAQLGMVLDGFFLGAYVTSNIPGPWNITGAFGTTSRQIALRESSGFRSGAWAATSSQIIFGNSVAGGMIAVCRRSNADGFLGRGGSFLGFTQDDTAGLVPTSNLCVLRGGTSGATISPNRCGFWVGGPKMTTDQYLALEFAIEVFFQNLRQWDFISSILAEATLGPSIWTYNTINNLQPQRDVWWITTPPATNIDSSSAFSRFPISVCSLRPQNALTSTWTAGTCYLYMWANRWNGGAAKSPNDTFGKTIFLGSGPGAIAGRPECISYEDAIGQTLAQTAYILNYKYDNDPDFLLNGVPSGWAGILRYWAARHAAAHPDLPPIFNLDYWDAAWAANQSDPIFTTDMNVATGDVIHHAYALANPTTVFTKGATGGGSFAVSQGRMLLPINRMHDVTATGNGLKLRGLDLDYEVGDGRPDDLGMELFQGLSQLCHGRLDETGAPMKLMIDWFPLDSGQAALSAMNSATVPQIMALPGVGYATIYVKGRAAMPGDNLPASLANQAAVFTGPNGTIPIPWSKIILHAGVGVGPNGMDLQDAQDCRTFLNANPGITNVSFTPNGRPPGGDMTNPFNIVINAILDPSSP